MYYFIYTMSAPKEIEMTSYTDVYSMNFGPVKLKKN